VSYLVLPNGIPNFSSAVISLWFRVPKASVVAAQTAPYPEDGLLYGTIPLITFGQPLQKTVFAAVRQDIAVMMNDPFNKTPFIETVGYIPEGSEPLAPSFIAVDTHINDPRAGSAFTLAFNLQTPVYSNLTWFDRYFTRIEQWSGFGPPGTFPPPGSSNAWGTGWVESGFFLVEQAMGFGDSSYRFNDRPEYFYIDSPIELVVDHWHHLLLSFDLGGGCNTHGPPQPGNGTTAHYESTAPGTVRACRLWYAIDDVNYNGANDTDPDRYGRKNLGPFFVDGGGDPNAILSDNAWEVVDERTGVAHNLFYPASECDFAGVALPALGSPFGIPAVPGHVGHIFKVEMAELQIFTGATLDTGVTANRRAFVDAEGKPVPPTNAETLLGRRPAVLLHGSGNWQQGKNTGSLGLDNENNPIPAGQFQRQGVINAYQPDPSLHGQQARRAGPVQLTRTAAHAGL
jgi:hypothetical protein